MSIRVSSADPRAAPARALLAASHRLMQRLYPPEDNHYLSVDALLAPGILFFTADRDGETVGCGALALKEGYAELKSIYVPPGARGSGVADAVLQRLESEARQTGRGTLKLETGNTLHTALRFYTRHGFSACDRFGDYPANTTSLFMEKRIA